MVIYKGKRRIRQTISILKKVQQNVATRKNNFLTETEKMSNAFEKIPSIIWEDEYSKYRDVMDTYRDIKVDRWKDSSTK